MHIFDEHFEIIRAFEELQQNIKIVPSRYYISIAKIIYDKIDKKIAKIVFKSKYTQ